jgi:hypothetical protein
MQKRESTRTETQSMRLRARIARLRRRIDRQASRAVDDAMRWAGWRSYVSRYPGRSLAAAAGVGFALSAICDRIRWPDQFGVRLYDLAIAGAWRQIWDLTRQVAIDGSQETPSEPAQGE